MADFVGRALVQIRADTTGFQADVRKQTKDALAKVKLTINVSPTTVGFQAELRKQVRNAIATAGKFTVPVTPELTTFKKTFAAGLRESPLEVPIVPDMAAFIAQLDAKIAAINKSIGPVKVPVVATGGTPLGGPGGSAAQNTEKASRATRDLSNAQKQLADSSRVLGSIERERTLARAAHNKALLRGLPLEQQAEAVNSALRSSGAALSKIETEISLARAQGNKALVSRLQTLQPLVASEKALIAETARLVNFDVAFAASTQAAANATQGLSNALSIEVKTLASTTETRRLSSVLKASEAEITLALAEAEALNNTRVVESLTLLRQDIELRLKDVAARQAQLASASGLERRERQLAKGAASSGAALLGVRGATLAASGAFLAGSVAVAAFSKAVRSAAALEQELNVFAATSGATADEMTRAGEAARQLGADITLPAVSASDAAEAMTELAKAGLSVEDSLAGTRGVLQLATAAQIDNAEATLFVASALNAFSLSGEQATVVADLLAGASIEAQGSIEDIGVALQQSAAAARQAGISLQDTIALLALLARNGLRGSDAGTSLRTALLRVINPTKKARAELEKLNVSIRDQAGNVRPDIFAQLSVALSGFSRAQRDATLAIIFGQDAFRAASILGREGAAGLDEMRGATQELGLASDLAGARTKGFSGSLEALSNSVSTLGTNLGRLAIPPLQLFVDELNNALTFINDFTGTIESFAGKVANLKIPPIKIELVIAGKKVGVDEGGFKIGEVVEKATREAGKRVVPLAIGVAVPGANQILAVKKFVDSLVVTKAEKFAENVKKLNEEFKLQGSILADDIPKIETVIARLGRLPTKAEVTRLVADPRAFFRTLELVVNEARKNGTISADALHDAWVRESQSNAPNMIEPLRRGLSDFPEIAADIGRDAADRLGKAFRFTLEDTLAIAEAGGTSDQGLLGILREREARQQATFDRLSAITDPSKAQKQRLATVASNLNATRDAIQEILDAQNAADQEAADKAKDSADKAKEIQDERDQALLDRLGRRESRLQRAMTRAGLTPGLADDIKLNRALKAAYQRQINIIRQTVKDKETRNAAIRELQAKSAQLDIDLVQLRRDSEARIRESLELDIDFASTRENIGGEIRAREALIRHLQKLQQDTKKGTVEYKRLRNAIAEQRAAIKDLKEEQDEKNNDFAQLAFSFLQSQQGFAANLFGNLIPGGTFLGGLVGNPNAGIGFTGGGGAGAAGGAAGVAPVRARQQDPGDSVTRAAALAQARGAGTTSGQSATMISLMQQMVILLKSLNGRQMHPEAQRQKKESGAAYDVQHYGY